MAEAEKAPRALEVFLRKSGYSGSDVSTWNPKTLIFGTWNGGKYQLSKRGEIRKLHGPDYPSYEAPE